MAEKIKSGRIAIVSPCHGTPLEITTRDDGMLFQSYHVPDKIYCMAASCDNSWDAQGNPSDRNKD